MNILIAEIDRKFENIQAHEGKGLTAAWSTEVEGK
jgi:hypothetical protein